MSESAFKGTVKEGWERKYTVINENDLNKYVPVNTKEDFRIAFNEVADWIENGRMKDGKEPYNNYVVINLDEPYIGEIIDILMKNGHWG
ncbi:hypothetical protein [Gracilibacillus lacisalsi]|uniref:hypothetical protein n=1 Tax=Gracilibacillus lacisalsi TaxID=393087 RepID=UPI000363403E|nr:hypothetical protein [Gracilibacillus lacisalsi]